MLFVVYLLEEKATNSLNSPQGPDDGWLFPPFFGPLTSIPSLKFTSLTPFLSLVRSQQCDDIDEYFGNVGSVTEIDLGSVIRVDCSSNNRGEELPVIIIESGKTLTVKSSESFVE